MIEEFLKQTHVVFYIQGNDATRQDIYVFIAVSADKLAAFMRAIKQFPIDLHEYGAVLATGEGLPPQETRNRMIADYGFNEANMIVIT